MIRRSVGGLSTLRQPLTPGYWSLTERSGYLRLRGQEGLSSKFNQSLIARRWEEFCFETATCVEFERRCLSRWQD
ncbi:MAG: hypothetical protein ACLS3U_06355 [Lachnospiraceae bacterium]